MTYVGDGGEASASLVTAGAMRSLDLRSGSAIRFIARGDQTGGRFGLFLLDLPPRSDGASPHFHRTFSESFYLVGGAVDLHDGRAWVTRGTGDFLYVPEGGIHGFRNGADGAASLLILFAPGAPRERYFEELAGIASSGRQLSADAWAELYARHDQFMV